MVPPRSVRRLGEVGVGFTFIQVICELVENSQRLICYVCETSIEITRSLYPGVSRSKHARTGCPYAEAAELVTQ
jgi:hypothetical protein